ncbi:MAG: hypothetical protein ACR2N3_04795 [Pyrinomonadaceae bacterium]
MPTVEELGKKIKKKYPGKYDNLSDSDLGRKIKIKFKGKYDQYEDVALAKASSNLPVKPIHNETRHSNMVGQLLDFYKPSKGRLTSWWQQGKSESRVALLKVLTEEQMLLIQKGAMIEAAVMQGKKSEYEFKNFVETHNVALLSLKHQSVLINEALKYGLTVETYQQLKQTEGLNHLEINRAKELTDIEVKREKEISWVRSEEYARMQEIECEKEKRSAEIQSNKHYEIEKINLDNKILEKQEIVKLALIAGHLSEIQKMRLVQEQIDDINKDIDQIESNPEFSNRLRKRMIEDREEMIKTLKENRRARARLLEADNGEIVQEFNLDTEL